MSKYTARHQSRFSFRVGSPISPALHLRWFAPSLGSLVPMARSSIRFSICLGSLSFSAPFQSWLAFNHGSLYISARRFFGFSDQPGSLCGMVLLIHRLASFSPKAYHLLRFSYVSGSPFPPVPLFNWLARPLGSPKELARPQRWFSRLIGSPSKPVLPTPQARFSIRFSKYFGSPTHSALHTRRLAITFGSPYELARQLVQYFLSSGSLTLLAHFKARLA